MLLLIVLLECFIKFLLLVINDECNGWNMGMTYHIDIHDSSMCLRDI